MKLNKDFLILLIGRVGQAGLALVAIRVLTSLLDRENVGLTYLVASLTSYFSLIFINPVGMYLNRKLHQWFKENKLQYAFRHLNGYFLAVSIFSIPLVLLSYYAFGVGTGMIYWQICLLVFLNIYIGTWFQTLCPSLNMLEYRTAFVSINLLVQLVGFASSIVLILVFEKSAFFWLLGILGGQVIGTLLSWMFFKKHVRHRDVQTQISFSDLFYNKPALYFCLPIAITTAFMWGQGQSYRLIVESKMGASTLGILGVGFGVAASIAGLIESLVSQYFYPRYYSTISNEGPESRVKAWQVLCLNSFAVYIPVMIFVAAGAKFLLKILVSAHFEESMSLVVWGAAIEFFRMTTNLIYTVSQSEMKTKSTIFPYAIAAGTVILGLAALFRWVGHINLIYIPMILVLAGVVGTSCMYWSMKQILPIRLDYSYLALVLFYSVPLLGMVLLRNQFDSLVSSILICGVFGIYLLWVIWRLYLRSEEIRKTF